jgi:hypothetical protein
MPTFDPVEPVDVAVTLAEIRSAREHNEAAEQLARTKRAYELYATQAREQAAQQRAQAAELLLMAEGCDRAAAEHDASAAAITLCEAIDIAPLEQRLEQAEGANRIHRALEERARELATVAELEAASQAITDRMTAREAERAAVIAAADMPVPGIGLTEDGVTLNGVPLDQASTAEQLRLSAAIGMALNPKLRVMVIRDGSLLDEDSLQLLTEAAAAEDFVILCEVVDTSGEIGIYIEDGSVKAVNGQAVGVADAA